MAIGSGVPHRDPEAWKRLARGLGVASVGLGVTPLLAPGPFARAIGVDPTAGSRLAARLVGARELGAAAGLLSQPRPGWLWARVGGDVIDLTLLGRALADRGRRGGSARTVAAVSAVAAITAVDVYAAVAGSRPAVDAGPAEATMELTASTTVAAAAKDLYERWRRLDDLPQFMAHLQQVRTTGATTSHWQASAPFGRVVEWDAEITDDVPGERIAWRSVGDADVDNEGRVEFRAAPGGRGTEVHVTMRYRMPAGALGAAAARYFGEEPHQQLDDDLRRFKQVVETGEVVRSDGAPGGKRARREFPQHAARPLSADELAEEARA